MKKNLLLIVYGLFLLPSAHAQYPASFSWLGQLAPSKENQVVQGPCNVFATVANMEAWWNILYHSNSLISQQHMYSDCGSPVGNGSIATTIQAIQTYGIVDAGALSWGNSNVTCTGAGCTNPYYGNIKNNQANPNKCTLPFGASNSYHIAASGSNNLKDQLTSLYPTIPAPSDRLKRFLLNYGPVSVNMKTNPSSNPNDMHLHGDYSAHAYLIYGWDASNHWLLKDSWPADQMPGGYTIYTNDLANDILTGHTVLNEPARYLSSVAGHNAVYEDNNNPPVRGIPTTSSGDPVNYTGNNLPVINFSTPSGYVSALSPLPISLTNLGWLDAGYTIQWGSRSVTSGASAYFANPNSASTTISNGLEGWVTVFARITSAHGVVEEVVYPNSVYVCPGLPIDIRKNTDACSGTTRYVQWQIIGKNGLVLPTSMSVVWNLTPPTVSYGVTYNTNRFPNDVFYINLYNMTGYAGYTLRPVVTDNVFNHLSGNLTQGASESPCAAPHAVKRKADSSFSTEELPEKEITSISVFPNPATNILQINLPSGKQYMIRILTIYGAEILNTHSSGSLSVNVSAYSKGIYILQVINQREAGTPFISRVVVE